MKHFFNKTNLVILILTFVLGVVAFPVWVRHNRSRLPNSFVMKYSDFGPSSSSYDLLESEGYQRNGQEPDDLNGRDDVKVVIYRNVDLATVKRTYPAFKGRSDYRYIEYSDALDFLEKRVEELKADDDRDPEYSRVKEQLISDYKQTRDRIIERLGP